MLERYTHRYEWTIPDYDCDPFMRLTAPAVLRYMQHAATTHFDRLGFPYERLYQEGIVFVLVAAGIKFYKSPERGQRVIVATCPIEGKGAQLFRETVILSEQEELLIEGQFSWAMLNPSSQRLLRVSNFHYGMPLLEDWNPFFDPSRLRINVPNMPLGLKEVQLSDLDRNLHMNNAVYAEVLLNAYAPRIMGRELDSLFLRYRTQARLGEKMALFGDGDGETFSIAAKIEGKPCFEGKFCLKSS